MHAIRRVPNALWASCATASRGSAVGAIPSIIGDTGFVANSPDRDYLRKLFEEILATDSRKRLDLGLKARQRIAENYHISKRERAFFEVIEDGISGIRQQAAG